MGSKQKAYQFWVSVCPHLGCSEFKLQKLACNQAGHLGLVRLIYNVGVMICTQPTKTFWCETEGN